MNLTNEIIAFFKDIQTVSFATSVDNIPHVRPMTMIWFENRILFVTGDKADKTTQLLQNPKLETCLSLQKDEYRGYIRLNGPVQFVKDKDLKHRVFNSIDFIKVYFESPDSESFILMELLPKHCELLKPGEMDGVKGKWELSL